MPIRYMSARLSLVAAVAAINLVGVTPFYAVSHGVDANKDPGKHSAFTREQLRTTWAGAKRFPLVVPARMPAGAESDPEIGFSLDNVVTDPAHHLSRRVWVSYYESDVLGGRGTSFRIFQRDRQVPSRKPCGPVAKQQFVQRHVANAVVTICSSALSRGSSAREYWESVPFTSDYERVDWLEGDLSVNR